jgi:D-alanyl-D-alanine carboxypeptidase
MKNLLASFFLVFGLAVGQPQSQVPAVHRKIGTALSDLSRQVDTLFGPLAEENRPGAVVLVAREGKVLHKKAYGMADLSRRIPLTTASVFDLGSIGKSFTALAIMLLAQDGKLSYDDPLTRFFPEFATYASDVKIRHLLQHTAGLDDYEEILKNSGQLEGDYPRSASAPTSAVEPTSSDVLGLLSKHKLRFLPGTKYEYSNSGYVLLGQVVAKASNQPYADFLQKRIFRPLKMTSTVVYNESRPLIPGRAVSYKRSGTGYVDIDYSPLNIVYGDGSINSNVDALLKFDQALYSSTLLKTASLAEAFRSGTLRDGTPTEYGFGWMVRPALGLPRIAHGGTWGGFRTRFVRYPRQRFVVILLGNFLEFDRENLAYQVAKIYLSDEIMLPKAVSIPSVALDALTGSYDACKWLKLGTQTCEGEIESREKYEVGNEGKGLWLRYPDGNIVTLLPLSKREFFISGREDTRVVFHEDQRQQVVGMSITNFVQQTAQRSF